MVLTSLANWTWLSRRLVLQDGSDVALAETLSGCRLLQRLVDDRPAMQRGQCHGLGHLRRIPGRALGRRLEQPALGAGTDHQEKS